MAGYEPKRQLIELDFSETEHAGLEVTTRKIDVDGLLAFVDLIDKAEQLDSKNLKPEDLAIVDQLFTRFARVLVKWNLTNNGRPVPPTREGIGGEELEFVMQVINAWFVSVSTAPPPLKGASPNGLVPPEASLPMDAVPASPPS